MPGYLLFRAGNPPNGRILLVRKMPKKRQIDVYIEVEEIDEKLKEIRKGRGKVFGDQDPGRLHGLDGPLCRARELHAFLPAGSSPECTRKGGAGSRLNHAGPRQRTLPPSAGGCFFW
jgi:hypothetical protein